MKTTQRKNKGMTIAECVVSGGVMLMVIVMSFEVMVAGTKVSTKAANNSEANEESRSVLEQFTKDVNRSDAIISYVQVGARSLYSKNEAIVIRAPKFNNNGSVRPNEYEYIIYYSSGEARKQLIRQTISNIKGSWKSWSPKDVVVDDLLKVNFSYFRHTALSFDSQKNGYVLPYPLTDSVNPPQNRVSLLRLDAPWINLSTQGLKAIKANSNISLSSDLIKIVGQSPSSSPYVSIGVNPCTRKSPPSSASLANGVRLTLVTRNAKGSRNAGESELSTIVTLKNERN